MQSEFLRAAPALRGAHGAEARRRAVRQRGRARGRGGGHAFIWNSFHSFIEFHSFIQKATWIKISVKKEILEKKYQV